MIKFFRQSYPVQYVILLLMALALWLPSFVPANAVTGLDSPVTPLFNLIDGWLGGSAIAQRIVAFVLLLLDALILNTILTEHQIVGKVGTMGAFVLILLMSLTRTQINFYPFALSAPFILLVMGKLYGVYLSQKPELDLFKAGVYIAFASACYFPAIILIIWTVISMFIVKNASLRLLLLPVTGFLFTYFLYFSMVFMFGDFSTLLQGYADWFDGLSLTVEGFNMKNIMLLVGLVAVSILMLLGSGSANFDKTLAVRTKMTISILLSVFALFLLFMGGTVLFHGLIFIVLAIVISYEFSYISNTGWADLFLTAFMMLVVANQYYFKMI